MCNRPNRGGISCLLPANFAQLWPLAHCGRTLLWIAFAMLTAFSARGQYLTNSTGIQSDLAIAGPGYFILHDPAQGIAAATRQGFFNVDANGYLVSPTGMRVQGFSDGAFTQIGDIKIDNTGLNDTSYLVSYSIQPDGKLIINLSDGTQAVRGQILLQNFSAPANLSRFLNGLFIISPSAGPLPQPIPPGTAGLGNLQSGQIESPIPTLSLSRVQSPPPFTQGILASTAQSTDLAIYGNGFFIVRDTNSSVLYATRAGAYYLDANGYLINLINYAGMRVQGYTDANLSVIGDITINTNGITGIEPSVGLVGFGIDWTGTIQVTLSDGSAFVCGQILLANCTQTNLLVRTNFGLYPMTTSAGPWTPLTSPGSTNFGFVISGTAELSQFDQSILDVRSHLNFFQQGALTFTANPTDLAISGNGFFTVRDPAQNIQYATRNGAFHLDSASHLIDTNGFRVQGLADAALTTVGDLIIDTNSAPSHSTLSSFAIDSQGEIMVNLTDGTTFVRGQILLQEYRDLQALVPNANLLYSNVQMALPLYAKGLPGTQGLGFIQDQALETPYVPAALQLPPQTGFRLLISDLDVRATVQSSPDLHTWTDLGPAEGSITQQGEFFDTNVTPKKFYRVHLN